MTKEELRNLRYVQHEEDQISLLHTSGHLQKEKERDSLIRMIPIRKSHTKVCFGYLHRADCVLRVHTEEYLKQLEEKLK